MIEILFIGLITYYVTLFVIVYKCNLKEMLNCEKPRIRHPPEPEPVPRPEDLIIKSSFTWREPEQPTAPETEEKTEEQEESPETEYYDDETEEPETEDSEDEEQEQFEELRQKEILIESSTIVQPGVTSKNINQVINVIKNKDATDEEESEAANNIVAMQNDQIFQTITNTAEAEERVNYLLKKRMQEYFNSKATTEASGGNRTKEYQNFNINNYA